MEWYLKIPKILHVYWGGGKMHYLRLMTIKSFMKYNPDWKVMFWYPKYPTRDITWGTGEQNYDISSCRDFTPELMELPITKTPVDFREHGFPNNIPEVHKSDYIRLYLLSTFGGLWSDMDILYFKPMSDLYLNVPGNKDIETFYCNRLYGHSVGFLMGCEKNMFFKKLAEISKREFTLYEYQGIGCKIYNRHFSTHESINTITPAINISMNTVYAHHAGQIEEILSDAVPRFTEETIGLHWYAGSPSWKDFLLQTNGGLENLPNTIIGNLLKNTKNES